MISRSSAGTSNRPGPGRRDAKPFRGKIALDVRDSTPDWEPFVPQKAPEGSPNVLIVLYDDTGMASWSPFGGRIEMPTLQRLADDGLMYSQWHTTALCSPTRSCFLTGRNHHQNGMACITEASTGFPGASGHIPPECGTLAEVMRKAGWSTFWLGKNHNVPVDEAHAGGSKEQWPLQQGWERFYGFIGGETNQWYPDLIVDNHQIEQPYRPEEGYHLSKDLADQAIQMIRDVKATAPSRPGSCGSVPARTTRRTMRRRSTSTSTRAPSTTATRPTANGCSRA